MLRPDRLCETRQTEAALELISRAEKRLGRNEINVNSRFLVVVIFIVKGRLSSAFAHHVVFFLVQLRAEDGVAWYGFQITYLPTHFFLGVRLKEVEGNRRHHEGAQ